MNNLKFRAWDNTAKKMSKVTAIDFSTKPFRVFYKAYGNENYFNQDAILMQSTGLHDKNGVEIFEGDIVKIYIEDRKEYKVYYALYKVVFDEETLTTKLEIIERFCDMLMPPKYLYFKNVEDIVIAGNIYENKELLRK